MGIIAPRQNWLNRNASAHGSSQQAVFGMSMETRRHRRVRRAFMLWVAAGMLIKQEKLKQAACRSPMNPPRSKAPGYRGKGFRPDVSGRHQSPKRASGNCAVRIKWIPRNGWRLTMSGWSVRFSKTGEAAASQTRNGPFSPPPPPAMYVK